jgi:KipI family sensor histidine kinase inhibitor
MRVDINCDTGEGMPSDAGLMKLVTTANIACGGHAGDEGLMRRTVRLALENGVAIGAHPGFPDRANFGRKTVEMRMDELQECVASQVRTLAEIAREEGGGISSVKPHGALYNRAMEDGETARRVIEASRAVIAKLTFTGLPGSAMERCCLASNADFVIEGFPDRAYDRGGRLVPRNLQGATIDDAELAASRGVAMASGKPILSIEGAQLRTGPVQTLCIHGDAPNATEIAGALRRQLEGAGFEVRTPTRRFNRDRAPGLPIPAPNYLSSGDSCMIIEYPEAAYPDPLDHVRKMSHAIGKASIRGVVENVPSLRSIAVCFDPLKVERAELIRRVAQIEAEADRLALASVKLVKVPVHYGGERGPDLEFVARHNGITPEDVVRIHCGVQYVVTMLGFTPGFPYLRGMSEKIAAPRLESPRKIVRSGSVGIAGIQTGIYPADSPGGWRIIGWTPLGIFDPAAKEPFLFSPGDRLEFVPQR